MIAAFRSESDDRACVYRLLSAAYARAFGAPCPQIARDGSGKPFFPGRPEVHFSLSHTKGACLAVLSDAPVGCDIELVRPVSGSAVRRVCTAEELESLDFFSLWTLKEAYFKLHGSLPHPMWASRFAVSSGVILTPDPDLRAALYSPEKYRAALVTPLLPPPELAYIPLADLP